MKTKVLSIIIVIIMGATVLTGCSAKNPGKKVGTSPNGNEVPIEAAAIKLVNAQKEAGYELVSTNELKSWLDQKKDMIVIDTMPKNVYDKGHISGAVQAELPKEGEATAEQKDAFIKLLGSDKEKTIVVYCGFTACGRSHLGAKIAKELGFKNVYRYPGGIIGWQDANFPVEK